MKNEACERIADEILDNDTSPGRAKTIVCRELGLERVPSNADILESVTKEKRERLIPFLKKKPMRTMSGVAVVAVMTSPEPCPHGRCLYCPTGENAPQSYTGFEPAALRGKRSGFDPYIQVRDRLQQLHTIGHNVGKTELIIMGGTFPARDSNYQNWFVKRCFDGMNSFGYPSYKTSRDLAEAHRFNEITRVRNVGVTFETRPDYAMEEHIDRMLSLGGTRIEMGVQSLDDNVLRTMKRGHALKDVIRATKLIKDAGIKLGYHMMPGLFKTPEEDLRMFRRLFTDPDFRPDMLKIYPTLVLEGTGLYEMWSNGDYEPPGDEEAVDLIVKIKKIMPPWLRTMRIQRDIPSGLIAAGVKKGNLGELVQDRLADEGVSCRCIRCREVGRRERLMGLKDLDIEIEEEIYDSSKGMEFFVSAEDHDQDILTGYLRMRFPSLDAHRTEIQGSTAIIRELKVLGKALDIGKEDTRSEQHKGLGRSLLERAGDIARQNGRENLLVTSAVGTREYYKGSGFKRIGPYMIKRL